MTPCLLSVYLVVDSPGHPVTPSVTFEGQKSESRVTVLASSLTTSLWEWLPFPTPAIPSFGLWLHLWVSSSNSACPFLGASSLCLSAPQLSSLEQLLLRFLTKCCISVILSLGTLSLAQESSHPTYSVKPWGMEFIITFLVICTLV